METLIDNIKNDPYNYSKDLEIKQLENIIVYAADKFFNDESIISDAIYDLLVDFLRYKDPKNKTLKKIGSKVKSKNKVKLDYHLGSMDKIKPPSNKLSKWLDSYPSPYILTEKLDGVSGLLTYKKDGTLKLHTRGTATHGVDISPLLKYISRVPSFDRMEKFVKKNKLNTENDSNIISFRGELIISKKLFDNNWKDKKSNARNTVSGLVNSKSVDPYLAGDTFFVIYEVVDPFVPLDRQLQIAKDVGFRVVHSKKFKKLDYEILSAYLRKRKKSSKYEIDGIIVSNDKQHTRNIKGNPEYAFAFKDVLEDQKATSTILDIEWNISKHGYIIPTVVIKPVTIGGVVISRITANNARFVVDNKIGKGAIIDLIRSGDVIPKIEKIVKPVDKPDLPDGEWEWNKTKVDIIAKDLKCKDVIVKSNYYFFSTLNTKGMGEKIVEKLYDAGFTTIIDILNGTASDFVKMDGFKEKSANNLVNSIKKAMSNNNKGVSLDQIMAASNKLGFGMGRQRSKLILKKYPNIMIDYKKWSEDMFVDKIKEIPGWEEKTSRQFAQNFKTFIIFYEKIKKFITLKKVESITIIKSEYNNKKIVISGFRDAELEEKLKARGAKISTSVSKNTDILIVKNQTTIDDNTGKVKKAKELNIQILSRDKLDL
jgi:DNA ligase (NAD+)